MERGAGWLGRRLLEHVIERSPGCSTAIVARLLEFTNDYPGEVAGARTPRPHGARVDYRIDPRRRRLCCSPESGGVPHLVQMPSASWGYAMGVKDVVTMIVARLRRVGRHSAESEYTRREEGSTAAKHAHDNDLERYHDQTGTASGSV